MAEGYVYVLINEAMPTLVKVGKTTLSAEERADSLSASTSVPVSFTVVRSYAVTDCDVAEAFAHRVLERTVGRPNKNREFFNGPASTICAVLDEALPGYLSKNSQSGSSLFDKAVRHVAKNEFTIACLEFEQALSELDKLRWNVDAPIGRMLGMYVACCCRMRRQPVRHDLLASVRLRAEIMAVAIEVMGGWPDENDPAGSIINFMHNLARPHEE